MNMNPIFIPSPPARQSDPSTSQQAARDLLGDKKRLGDLQRRALTLVKKHPHKTAQELSKIGADKDPARTRRRLSELVNGGVVRVTGARSCCVTGKTAQTYNYVPKGERRQVIAKLSRSAALEALLLYAKDPCDGACVCGFDKIIFRARCG